MDKKTVDRKFEKFNRLINTTELREMIKGRYTIQTIYQYCSKGEIPSYKIGNRTFFDPEEIKQWIAARLN